MLIVGNSIMVSKKGVEGLAAMPERLSGMSYLLMNLKPHSRMKIFTSVQQLWILKQ